MKKLALLMVLMGTSAFCLAGTGTAERRERSFDVFAKGLDGLLIDTKHVFVQADNSVHGFYLSKVGAIFVGEISLTETANVSVMIKDWTKWFEPDESSESDEKSEAAPTPSGKASPKAEKENVNKEIKIRKSANVSDKDKERIEKMPENLAEFKKELIALVQDFGPVLKGLSPDDEVIVVLLVKDKEFKEKYDTGEIVLRVRASDLNHIKDQPVDDPEIQKAVIFNF
jgi:hypothetical protein